MNYRHTYHAGNLGDVLKHAVLTRLIEYLKRKDKAFRVLDTHAGIGAYDLTAEETRKTGEWQEGIGKVLAADMPEPVASLLAPWIDVLNANNPDGSLRHYPGSPALAHALVRDQDRLTLTELHPEDYETLADRFAGDFRVKAIHLDGWLALGSFLPPKEKRGLVLIDPAFEETDEFDRMTRAVLKAWKKWPGGIYALWYPLKMRKEIARMHGAFKDGGIADVFAIELRAGQSGPDTRMLGSGMTLINPPFTLAGEMQALLPWLCDVLRKGTGAGWSAEQIIAE